MNYTIIQNNEFPAIPSSIVHLYLDTETTSFDPTKKSIDVWKSCWVAGIAFTWDEHEQIYFIPVRYRDKLSEEKNNSEELTREFINSIFAQTQTWVNHNVKYDYHVLSREGYKIHDVTLFDTLTQAKLIESDRFVYNEDALSADWLQISDVDQYKRAMKPWIEASNDWGEVPIHIIAPYAAHDVHKERLLFKFIVNNLDPDTFNVSETENKVTKCLCRAEQVGLCVDPIELKKEELISTVKMAEIIQKISTKYGLLMRPNVNEDCYEIFHKQFKLPVVGYTEKGDPSYDKYALATLAQYPNAPLELIQDCLEYRKLLSHNGFVKSYTDLHVDGRLHASYNQTVRTGRMSCKEPNMQQLDKDAKRLIHPPHGYVFLSFDYSAIEFRLLAHYLGQEDILEAYQKDPDTDFHQWVADMCHVKRKPAKNINFCMAYGGGKAKVLSMLANNSDVIEELHTTGLSSDEFEDLCRERAESIFSKYHHVLHKLRPLTSMAANRLKARGYVKNGYGRHRQLPIKACYRALNTVIQSTAADCMKAAVVNTSPLYNKELANYGVEQVAFVHDEILFICPLRHLEKPYLDNTCVIDGEYSAQAFSKRNPVIGCIVNNMITDKFSVPMRVSAAIGLNNWADLIGIPKELIYGSN